MHCLENILLVTSVAVEKDEIGKAELVRLLRKLASESHDYIPDGRDESAEIVQINEEWHRRFGHLKPAADTGDRIWGGWAPR